MRICELRLINIKSYVDQTLHFQSGINFISGINGAGKTTIIESIGYVLFDHKPYNLRHFLREGSKSGEIQLLYEAQDERLYRVVRKFSARASTKWEVWDEETNTALDELHGTNDVALWIKRSLGLEDSENLESLYCQVIAVEQGLFTAPFLETPANRKQTFDQILKVEGYRQAFRETLPVERHFENEQKQLQQAISYLDEFLSELPVVDEQINKGKADLAKEEKRQVQLDSKLKTTAKLLQSAADLKKRLDALEKEIALSNAHITAHDKQIENSERDLEEANKAVQITSDNDAAYKRYTANQEKLEDLEKDASKSREIEKQVSSLDGNIKAAEGRLRAEQESIDRTKQELQGKLADLTEKYQNTEKAVTHWQNLIAETDDWSSTTKSWSNLLINIEHWIRAQQSSIDEAAGLRQRVQDLNREIAEITTEVDGLTEWQSLEQDLVAKLKLEEVRELIAKKGADRDALMRNKDYLEQGICPIIQEECPSEHVSGGLDQYFHTQLEALDAELVDLKEQEKAELHTQKELEQLRAKIQIGLDRQKSLERKTKERNDYLNQGIRLLDNVSFDQVAPLLKQLAGINDSLQESASQKESWFAKHGLECPGAYKSELLNQNTSQPVLAESTIGGLEAWLSVWASWTAGLNLTMDVCRTNIDSWHDWTANLINELRSGKQVTESNLQSLSGQISERQEEMSELEERQKEIEQGRSELQESQQKLAELQEQLAAFAGLDQEIDALKQELKNDDAGHRLYQENIQLAKRHRTIQEQLSDLVQERQAIVKRREEAAAELAILVQEYDAEEHEALEQELQDMNQQKGSLEKSIELSKTNLEELLKKQKKLIAWNKEREEKDRELKLKQTAGKLAQALRRVLRDAADPIAGQFRRYLSTMATEIYRQVSDENVRLEWAGEYELRLVDNYGGSQRVRVFKQLSGGEQMIAALAIRLAMMRLLSKVGIGFFDEPTTNLDVERRQSLAQAIQHSTTGFNQLFIISHDDAFDALTENTIMLSKDKGHGTKTLAI